MDEYKKFDADPSPSRTPTDGEDKNASHSPQKNQSFSPFSENKIRRKVRGNGNPLGDMITRLSSSEMLALIDPVFNSESFDAKLYTSSLFESMQIAEIRRQVKEKLLSSQNLAAQRLQKNVHSNYPFFIAASKDIAKLDTGVLELRNGLGEIGTVFTGLRRVSFNSHKLLLQETSRKSPESNSLVKDVHWLLELPDELDILISERLFKTAVEQVEKANKLSKSLLPALRYKGIREPLEQRVTMLSQSLLKELRNLSLKKTETRMIITYLTRLGYAEAAQEIYFSTINKKIRTEISKLAPITDGHSHIEELAYVLFASIDSTCDDFLHCFNDDTSVVSGLLVWVIRVIQKYSQFKHSTDVSLEDLASLDQSFDVFLTQCRMLKHRGLSIAFYVRQIFQKPLVAASNQFRQKVEDKLVELLSQEPWEYDRSEDEDHADSRCTESCRYVNHMTRAYLDSLKNTLKLGLEHHFQFVYASLIQKYFSELLSIVQTHRRKLDDHQRVVLLSDAFYLCGAVSETVDRAPDHLFTELKAFQKYLGFQCRELERLIVTLTAQDIVYTYLERTNIERYQVEEGSLKKSGGPSKNAVQVVQYVLKELKEFMVFWLGLSKVPNILTGLWIRIFDEWHLNFSAGGALEGAGRLKYTQFVVDVCFLLEAALSEAKNGEELEELAGRMLEESGSLFGVGDIAPDERSELKMWAQDVARASLKQIGMY
ncbi:uncharacterized protein LOC126313328 [Schistocerca gregaria]|uniref:uncharacterized protein LOC126313328 n=1 Tax=Schistocerca gregaria TaxID=7010 RepID=UPI00211F36AF|nr:uncharacterized protein LOC126313328 [Schistocerca gregaria]